MQRIILLLASHGFAIALGFAGGVYLLPILTAPAAPDDAVIASAVETRQYTAEFSRDRADSDFLHWGEGVVSISDSAIVFNGKLAPGPDYRLYLSKDFVETEADFSRLKAGMTLVGKIDTFNNFMVAVPPGTDLAAYTTVIVWCEAFGEFITSGRYQIETL